MAWWKDDVVKKRDEVVNNVFSVELELGTNWLYGWCDVDK